ncbi:hypothetical protein YC2023_047369 [Brassica napus]
MGGVRGGQKEDGRIGVSRCIVDGTLVVCVIVVVVRCVLDGTLVVRGSVVVVGSVVVKALVLMIWEWLPSDSSSSHTQFVELKYMNRHKLKGTLRTKQKLWSGKSWLGVSCSTALWLEVMWTDDVWSGVEWLRSVCSGDVWTGIVWLCDEQWSDKL